MKHAAPCLRIVAPKDLAEELSWDLAELGAAAVEQRDPSTMACTGPDRAELVAGFADRAARDRAVAVLAHTAGDRVEIEAIEIGDNGWSKRWREFFEPLVLSRLQVVAPWMAPPRSDLAAVVIDPGQAFGTGGHLSTRLILEMLEQRAQVGQLPARALDVGTGSGILAVAAVKLGVQEVTAVDIDRECVSQTQKNAARNRIQENIDVRHCAVQDLQGRWPLIMANIDLAGFKDCAGAVAARMEATGQALLSGLLIDQVAECLDLWPGFEAAEVLQREGWAALAVQRKS